MGNILVRFPPSFKKCYFYNMPKPANNEIFALTSPGWHILSPVSCTVSLLPAFFCSHHASICRSLAKPHNCSHWSLVWFLGELYHTYRWQDLRYYYVYKWISPNDHRSLIGCHLNQSQVLVQFSCLHMHLKTCQFDMHCLLMAVCKWCSAWTHSKYHIRSSCLFMCHRCDVTLWMEYTVRAEHCSDEKWHAPSSTQHIACTCLNIAQQPCSQLSNSFVELVCDVV